MQESEPGANAQGNDEGAVTQPVAGVAADASTPSLAVDVRVVVTSDTSRLAVRQHKWAGKMGVISQRQGDRAWMVAFRGSAGGLSSFDASELTALAPNAVTPVTQASRPSAMYRGPNGETWSGRGLMPRWLAALVADGQAKADFRVPA